MKLTKYLTETANKLKENPYSSANIEARLLLSYVLQIDINKLFLNDDLDLTIDQKNQLKKLIKRIIRKKLKSIWPIIIIIIVIIRRKKKKGGRLYNLLY